MSNPDVAYSLRLAILPILWILTSIALLIVIARVATKRVKFDGLRWEDHLMVVAAVLAIFFAVLTTLLYQLGLGLHETRLFSIPKFAEYFYLGHALGFLSPFFARTSFCLYMMRVLCADSRSKTAILWIMIGLQLLVNVAMTTLVLSQCGSFHTLWANGLGGARPASCVSHAIIGDMATWTTSFNAFTDVFLTALPGYVVWNITAMHSHTKLSIFATLGLSLFASAASICKAYYTYTMYSPKNTPKVLAQVYIVMAVEVTLVIIVASLPILAPLFLHRNGRGSSYRAPELPDYQISGEDSRNGSKSHELSGSSSTPRGPSFPAKYDSAIGHTKATTLTEREVRFSSDSSIRSQHGAITSLS